MDLTEIIYFDSEISRVDRSIKYATSILKTPNIAITVVNDITNILVETFNNQILEIRKRINKSVKILKEIDHRLLSANEKYKSILNKRKSNILTLYKAKVKELKSTFKEAEKLNLTQPNIDLSKGVNELNSFLNNIEKELNHHDISRNLLFIKEFLHVLFTDRKHDADDKVTKELFKKQEYSILKNLPLITNPNEYKQGHRDFNINKFLEFGNSILEYNTNYLDEYSENFEYYFMLGLRQTELKNIDDYLTHHAQKFESDFRQFLTFALMNFDHFINSSQKQLTDEWLNKKKSTNFKTIEIRLPKFKERTKSDNYTTLNVEQTALLFHYLKNSKVILNDTPLQPATEISKAIRILTGYSENTLRQKLSNSKQIDNINKDDLIVTQNILKKIIKLIDKDLEQL